LGELLAGTLTVATVSAPYKVAPSSAPAILMPGRDRFDVADASALPWPDNSIDLLVTSPPYALDIEYMGGDIETYPRWPPFSRPGSERCRACRELKVDDSASTSRWTAIAVVGNLFRRMPYKRRVPMAGASEQWLLWDKGQAGAGTDRGSLDSASAPNVTAAVESVLVSFAGIGVAQARLQCRTQIGWSSADHEASGDSPELATRIARRLSRKSFRAGSSLELRRHRPGVRRRKPGGRSHARRGA
jgi:hypothetical protein